MKKNITVFIVCLCILAGNSFAQRRMERLNRGVVAVRNSSSIFVSWRLLGKDPSSIAFNLYRSANGATAVKLNSSPITGGTNYTDSSPNLTLSNSYYVKPVVNGVEQTESSSFTVPANAASKPCFTVSLRNTGKIHFVWVGDLDGDGEYDYVVDRRDSTTDRCLIEAYKRDGTFLWDVNYGPNSANDDNISPGSATICTGNWDGVTVYDLDGDGKSEVITKIANGVRFGDGSTWSNSSNTKQWMAILNGETGALRSYVTIPQDYSSIGSLACSLGIGYLDGATPSIIGKFKNRNANGSFNLMVCAFKWQGSSTTLQWKWLRGSTAASDGHQIRIIDVDSDGTDEICDIGYCLNSNGTLRYSLDAQGVTHGDRTHIGKLDPNRAGIQGYAVQQDNPNFLYEYYYDASTGTILWKHFGTSLADVGRGAAGDIDPTYNGFEVWSFSGIYNAPSNTKLTSEPTRPYPNFRLWWDGDLLSENYDNEKIEKWNYSTSTVSRLVTCYNFDNANSGDRGAPAFYGDIYGDWREEVVMVNGSNDKLVVFTTNTATSTRIYTLAHNPAYRNCMTIKGYMQSHHTDFFLGNGMATPPVPNISYASGSAPVVSAAKYAFPETLTLGANAETGASALELYPNPLNGSSLNLKLPVSMQSELVFAISDTKGNVIYEKNLGIVEPGVFSTQLNLSTINIPAGSYIGIVRSKTGTESKVFVKQ